MGSILRDNLADVNCESKIAARQSGDGFAARHLISCRALCFCDLRLSRREIARFWRQDKL